MLDAIEALQPEPISVACLLLCSHRPDSNAVEERFRAGALDVISLHGLGNPDQEDLLLNGFLPELRRRSLLDADYLGDDFRSNLELPKPTVKDRSGWPVGSSGLKQVG